MLHNAITNVTTIGMVKFWTIHLHNVRESSKDYVALVLSIYQ